MAQEGVELVLEPMGFAPARTYQNALFSAGIPATAFITNEIASEYRHSKSLVSAFVANQRTWERSPTSFLRTPVATSSTWFNLHPEAWHGVYHGMRRPSIYFPAPLHCPGRQTSKPIITVSNFQPSSVDLTPYFHAMIIDY